MTLNSEFEKWKAQNNQHGGQAFSRFIMLKFLERLQHNSDEFIFKGGNLLWHYIQTPRETIDLDLVTLNLKSHLKVKKIIEKSCLKLDEIEFVVKEFKELDGVNEVGAAVVIAFKTAQGQKNQFTIDIVYSIPTDVAKVKSTLDGDALKAASIENIICDKMSAAYQFKSGNTRMKDFDDLWRIAKSDIAINTKRLSKLLNSRNINSYLDMEWVSFLQDSWKRHAKSYKDIPSNLEDVFNEINEWLKPLS